MVPEPIIVIPIAIGAAPVTPVGQGTEQSRKIQGRGLGPFRNIEQEFNPNVVCNLDQYFADEGLVRNLNQEFADVTNLNI